MWDGEIENKTVDLPHHGDNFFHRQEATDGYHMPFLDCQVLEPPWGLCQTNTFKWMRHGTVCRSLAIQNIIDMMRQVHLFVFDFSNPYLLNKIESEIENNSNRYKNWRYVRCLKDTFLFSIVFISEWLVDFVWSAGWVAKVLEHPVSNKI